MFHQEPPSVPVGTQRPVRANPPASWKFLAGVLAGILLPLLMAEMFLRGFPPEDIHEYLGEESPTTGVYCADPEIGADYRSFEDFQAGVEPMIKELGPLTSPLATWALFGNSFVQAGGMLGDTASAALPDIRMFYLQNNEPLFLRVAQARQLLRNGLRPQQLIFVIMPIDMLRLGKQPLSAIQVNERGAITYRVRSPEGPLSILNKTSRLALTLWVRSGQHVTHPSFRGSVVTSAVPSWLEEDLHTMLRVLGELTREYGVPSTILLLPNREQIFGQTQFALQDSIVAICQAEGLDCYDARELFLNDSDKPSLFLPDWHFSERGNHMLFQALQDHLSSLPNNKASKP